MFWRNGVIAASSPRMAFGNSFHAQPEPFENAVNLQRFYHIMRTRRFVPAVFWQQRRDAPLVNSDQYDQWKSNYFVQYGFQNTAKVG